MARQTQKIETNTQKIKDKNLQKCDLTVMSPSQHGGQTKKIKAKILQKCNLTMMSPTQRGGQTQTKWPIYWRAGNPANCTETQAYIGGQEYIGGIYLRASIYWRHISEGRQILLTNSTESKTTS